ncbi:SlyX family protein [Hyphococcus lacteus]|uniref:Protein SlyX homolog n=1 Tax=Hyphococcus lacteus TaxID=3143536 RepID=A0ABV3Z6T1_9PROT
MDIEILSKRLERLEERSAHQEQSIEELLDVVNEQQKSIETLRRESSRLKEELKQVEDIAVNGEQHEPPPPHY